MGLFEELTTSAAKRGAEMSEEYNKKIEDKKKYDAKTASEAARYNAAYVRGEARDVDKANNAIDRALASPNAIDNTAATLAVQHSSSTKKPKYAKFATKTEAVDAGITGSPVAGIADKLKNVYTTKLMDSKDTGKSIAEIQQEAVREVITPDVVMKSYEHKAKKDSSIGNAFGLFNTSSVKAVDGKALGYVDYDTWKRNVKAAKVQHVDVENEGRGVLSLDREQLRHDVLNASLGAAGSLLAAGAALAVPTGGASAVVGTAGAGVIAGSALVAGALAVPMGRIANAMARGYAKTDFATFHEGDLQERGVGLVVGGGALALGAKSAGAKVMLGFGAAGGAVGAASPETAVDLLGWTGAQAALEAGGTYALKKALKAGMASEKAMDALTADPMAKHVVDKFRADREVARARDAVTAEGLRTQTERALLEAETARNGAGGQLISALEKRKLALQPTETSGTVAKELRETDGDAVALADALQLERRLATPGGPNNFVAEPAAVSKGKGKGKKGAVVQDENALEKAHFNAFLDDMKAHDPAAWEAVGARIAGSDVEKEVYGKLFNTANRPTSLADGLSQLSWDGLDKVIGEAASDGWKVLSIGERVQIVKDAELAAHAAVIRGQGVVPGADRLASLEKPLVKALKDGMTKPPEELGKDLEKIVSGKGSPYVRNGEVDLMTLQTDLADHGLDSLQQLAFSLYKSGDKVVSAKKLVDYEEAVTAVRNSTGSNLVKLGIGGAVATSAMGVYNPDDSHAGVFDAVFKAGGKVFNNAAKETTNLAKFPAKITVKNDNLFKEMNRWGAISRDEFKYYELDKIPTGTTMTREQIAAHITGREPLIDVREATIGAKTGWEADAGFANYKPVLEHPDSKMVPDSYTEGFVEVNLQKSKGLMTPDQHTNYKDSGISENTLVRYRMDKSVGSDGTKEFILHELQEPSHVLGSRVPPEVKAARDFDGTETYAPTADELAALTDGYARAATPHALAIRAHDVGIKAILDKAKKEGVSRIVLATGEQQKSLYANALRHVMDSAEYVPSTHMLSPMKDGSVVSKYPQKVAPDKIAEHIGEDNARRLLENANTEKAYVTLTSADGRQKVLDANDRTAIDHTKEYLLTELRDQPRYAAKGSIKDITFDAKWPDALYGAMGPEGFNFKAKIPATVMKYAGKGATTGVKAGKNEEFLVHNLIGKELPVTFATPHHGTFKQGTLVTPELASRLESWGANKVLREKYGIVDTQPYIDLPKDMNTNYTIFTHPASLIGTAGLAATIAGERTSGTARPTPASEEVKGRYLGDEVLAAASKLGGYALDGIGSLFGASEAHAGGMEALGKLVGNLKTSQAAAVAIKDAGGSGIDALKYAHDSGLLFQEVPKGALSADGLRAGYLDTAPKGAAEVAAVVRRLEAAVPGQSLTTPYFSSQTLLKTADDGDRFLGNPAIQLAHGQSVVAHNTGQTFEILDNIYTANGIKLSKNNSSAIAETMLPVQKLYDGAATELRAVEAAAGHVRKEIALMEEEKFAGELIAGKKNVLGSLEDNIRELYPAFKDAKQEVEVYHRALAKLYPEARLSLAVEDSADFATRPWLKEMLSPSEKNAVLQIQNVMGEYKGRVIATMGEDAVIAGNYVKHSRALLPEQVERYAQLEEKLSKMGMNGKEVIALTKLHERGIYSQQMIPDIGRNMADYVPDVETRLMNADFWNKWKPFVNTTTVKNSPALKGMFDRIAESARPVEQTALRRFNTYYAKLETIRLIGGLVSAPAKHLFKVLGDVSQLGLLNTTSVMADAAAVGTRNFVKIQAGKLADAGFMSQETVKGMFGKTKVVDDFAAAVINQRGMVDYLADIEKTYGVGHRTAIDKILDPLTELSGMGIRVIETFDRTVSVLAAAKMANKNGMTGQQAMYGIYDTILKNNFLSGQLNSAWAKDPNVRALFLFQNTPFKIWERRVSNAVIAGTDLKTAFGTIKKQDLPAAQAELQGMRRWAAQASQAFKKGVIQDALGSSKDVFGNAVSGQFMREALGVGVVLSGGAMAGVNLSSYLLHTPFAGPSYNGDPTLSMSPITKAAWYAGAGKKPAGDEDWDKDDRSIIADFFKHWHGTAGYSLMASKFGRISRDEIPEQYKDSKFKFLFAMPAVKD